MGVTAFTFDDKDNLENQSYFSVSVGLGAKIALTQALGIRVGGRVMVPINFTGGGFYFGTGGGGVSGYGYVPILSGDVYGGLVFNIGKR